MAERNMSLFADMWPKKEAGEYAITMPEDVQLQSVDKISKLV